jgi:hypothetical protein
MLKTTMSYETSGQFNANEQLKELRTKIEELDIPITVVDDSRGLMSFNQFEYSSSVTGNMSDILEIAKGFVSQDDNFDPRKYLFYDRQSNYYILIENLNQEDEPES